MVDLKGIKVQMIDKSKFKFNVRNPRIDLDTTNIDPSIEKNGVLKPVICNQEFELFQGHRRITSVNKFPQWTLVPALVLDDAKLTEEDKLDLIMDHGEESPLSKAECFNAVKEFFKLSYGETAVIERCYAMLNQAFGSPSQEKIMESKAEAIRMHEDPKLAEKKILIAKHRGTIQNMKRLALLPDCVAEEYVKAWKGRNSLISQKDVKILDDLYNELWKTDPTIKRDNPPQIFLDKFEELKAINQRADSAEPKAVKRTKNDIENMMKSLENAIVRKTLTWVLGECTDVELRDYVKSK